MADVPPDDAAAAGSGSTSPSASGDTTVSTDGPDDGAAARATEVEPGREARTTDVEPDVDAGGTDLDPGLEPATRPRRPVRAEVLAVVEVCGLAGLAFTRPILDSFGRSPETFIARQASTRDVVLFAVAVALLPALAVGIPAAATRLLGPRARRAAHVAVIGALGAMVVWRFGTDIAPHRLRAFLVPAAVVGGVLLAVARLRFRPAATYLRFLGGLSLVFVAQFLVFSPASALLRGDGGTGDVNGGGGAGGGPAAVETTGGEAPPPIVMIVLDALPTSSLLDGDGHIDADLYPNLSALAGDATWYRNNTTVSPFTFQVVPSLLSGQLPEVGMTLPDTRAFPDNLFTLFQRTHDIEAVEQITRLCPTDACGDHTSGDALGTLLGDAVDWWRNGLEPEVEEAPAPGGAEFLPGALEPDRGDDFADWVARQDFSAGGKPGLWFYHLVMPHEPWDLLADGSRYSGAWEAPYGVFINTWADIGPDVGRQRQVLQTQAVDAMLGDLFDRLREAGTYDDTLIVVAGDHGQAIHPGSPLRGVAESQYEEVAWTPLIVKAPHQDEGEIDDGNVWNVDVVPTIADAVGVELPWDVDGVPAGEADRHRAPGDKQVIDAEVNQLEPAPGSDYVHLDGDEGFDRVLAADWVEAEGDLAVWQGGRHGALVGQAVSDLEVTSGEAEEVSVRMLDRIEDPGAAPPVLEVISETPLRSGHVAFALNGEVAAVAPVHAQWPRSAIHTLLMPERFGASNELTAYLVEGSPGSETLRPLAVAELED